MLIKKTIELCKKSQNILLFNSEEQQWISNGTAIYPMKNLPWFSVDNLCNTYDINEKKRSKMEIIHAESLPVEYDFSDVIKNEKIIERERIGVFINGELLIPYITSLGLYFIKEKYFSPFYDIDQSLLEVYERCTDDGKIYFAVKSGLILQGIIIAENYINNELIENLEKLSLECKIAKENLDL